MNYNTTWLKGLSWCLQTSLTNYERNNAYHPIYWPLVYSADLDQTLQNIRSFNSCEVPIENSIKMVTVQHHEACWVMRNSYPEWWPLFNPHLTTITDFILLSKIIFKLKIVILSIFIFSHWEMFSLPPTHDFDVEMCGVKWHQNWCHNVEKTLLRHACEL